MEVQAAVVTGAAQGLGLALVEALVRRGSDVMMVDLNSDRLDAAASQVRGATGRTVVTFAADVSRAEEVDAAARLARESFGAVQLAANVAGIIGPANRPIWEMSGEEVQRVLDINSAASSTVSGRSCRCSSSTAGPPPSSTWLPWRASWRPVTAHRMS